MQNDEWLRMSLRHRGLASSFIILRFVFPYMPSSYRAMVAEAAESEILRIARPVESMKNNLLPLIVELGPVAFSRQFAGCSDVTRGVNQEHADPGGDFIVREPLGR